MKIQVVQQGKPKVAAIRACPYFIDTPPGDRKK